MSGAALDRLAIKGQRADRTTSGRRIEGFVVSARLDSVCCLVVTYFVDVGNHWGKKNKVPPDGWRIGKQKKLQGVCQWDLPRTKTAAHAQDPWVFGADAGLN